MFAIDARGLVIVKFIIDAMLVQPGARLGHGVAILDAVDGDRFRHDVLLPAVYGCMCMSIILPGTIILVLRGYIIHSDPAITMPMIKAPNASANALLVLSDPVVMCRKNARCTPICATANAASAIGTPGV